MVPTYTLVMQNVALYGLGGAQDNFACSLSIFLDGAQCSVVSISVLMSQDPCMQRVYNYSLQSRVGTAFTIIYS